MAKVIYSMTAGIGQGDDYTAPTGDTPISLGEVSGKTYFSIDDGITEIAPFSTGRYNGDGKQASHWKNISNIGILKPSISRGSIGQFTENDYIAFDSIGFDRITSVETPTEPTPVSIPPTSLLLLVGLLSIIYARKII